MRVVVLLDGRQPDPQPVVAPEVGRDELVERHRLADEVALGVVDAELAHHAEGALVGDELGHGALAERRAMPMTDRRMARSTAESARP